MATFNEIMDAGLCEGACLMAIPKSACSCRCGGWLHSAAIDYLNRRWQGWGDEYPGFADIEIIHKGRRVRATDPQHQNGGWYGRRIA